MMALCGICGDKHVKIQCALDRIGGRVEGYSVVNDAGEMREHGSKKTARLGEVFQKYSTPEVCEDMHLRRQHP